MKIVIATPLYPPQSGGPATYSKLLEGELPKRGIEVALVKFSDIRGPKFLKHVRYALAVARAARGASLVYALDPVSTGLPAYIGSVLAGKPFVLKIVGDYAWEQGVNRYGVKELLDEFVTRSGYPLPVLFWKSVERFVARRARRIIVPSQYLKKIITLWGVDQRKITVVYNAPPVFAEPDRTPPLKGRYIVTVGRLVPWKGVDGVIRALALLDEGVSLVVIGEGPERARLESLVSELGLANRVVFTGALSHGDAPRYIAHAQAFVLDTSYEGFSHVILEAFALCTPVATTAAGGNPEQVIDGETGVVFAFNDPDSIAQAVRRLEDAALRERIVRNAQQKGAEFSRERMIEETLAALCS